MDDLSKPRINASMLPSFQGRMVCLMGIAKDVHQHFVDNNGTAFTLTSSDGKDVRITMNEPLSEYVSGLTEVHGRVNQQNAVMCENYLAFPKETSDTFDMNLYNDAVELSNRLQQYYIVGVQQ